MLLVWRDHCRGYIDVIRVHTIWYVTHGEDVASGIHHHWRAWWSLRRAPRALLGKACGIVRGIESTLEGRGRRWGAMGGEMGCPRVRWAWRGTWIPELVQAARDVGMSWEGRSAMEIRAEPRVWVRHRI